MKLFTLLSAAMLFTGLSASAQIVDGDFDNGPNSGAWTVSSTNFPTVFCDASCGTCGGNCAPNSGAWYIWFGGVGAVETGSVEQNAMIPSGSSASLNVMVKVATPAGGVAGDRLELSVDGNVLATVNTADSAMYADYTQLTADISSLADGAMHAIKIEAFNTTTATSNILADNINIEVDGVVTSVFEQLEASDNINVFPNPATDRINLMFGDVTGDAVVTVSSINGAVVSTTQLNEVTNNTFEFSTENMENGIYLVNVTNGNSVVTKRVVVAK